MISHGQKPGGSPDNGPQPLPLHLRPGITLPTPENLDRIAQDAADKRAFEAKAANNSPDALGRSWGVSRDLVLFLQRLEAEVIEVRRENAWLKQQIFNQPAPHLHNVERRG